MNSRPQRTAANCAAAEVIAPRATPAHAARPKHLTLDEIRVLDAEVARKAREACGLTQGELADFIGDGLQQQTVSAWENPIREHAVRTDHLRRAPVAFRRYVVRELCALDGDVAARKLAVVHESHALRTAALVKESSEALTGFAVDAADGNIDDPVARLQELHELRDAIDEAEAALRAAIESRRERGR